MKSHRLLRLFRKKIRQPAYQLVMLLSIGALLISLVPFGAISRAALAGQPNIIFIYADDLDRKVLPYMNNVRTLLADQGTTFENFFYNSALCCPSRATMLRGQYAHNTGVYSNEPIDGGFKTVYERSLEQSTVATWLQSAGYKTGYFGKYFNGYTTQTSLPLSYVPPGWNEWFGNGAGAYDGYGYKINHNGVVKNYGTGDANYSNDVVANAAINYIKANANSTSPLYLTISPFAPHHPFTPATRHKNLYNSLTYPKNPNFNEADVSDKPLKPATVTSSQISAIDEMFRNRVRSAQSVDEMVGNLVSTLQSQGKLDNTIIAFTSDNGFHIGEHRLAPTTGGKFTAYEEDIRVPLIVRGPGVLASQVRTELVGNVDVPVTFADLAGVTPPNFVDGASFAGLLDDSFTGAWRSSYLLQRGPQTTKPFDGLRTTRYKYVAYSGTFKELYDLQTDPYELNNIAKTAPKELLDALQARLDSLKGCATDECREDETAPLLLP